GFGQRVELARERRRSGEAIASVRVLLAPDVDPPNARKPAGALVYLRGDGGAGGADRHDRSERPMPALLDQRGDLSGGREHDHAVRLSRQQGEERPPQLSDRGVLAVPSQLLRETVVHVEP